MPRGGFSRGTRGAFTLVEMLVSVAVLILIMVFVSQVMNSTTIGTSLSGKHTDSDSQARLVFDRMADDFGRMPRRTDVDFIFSKQPDPLSNPGSSGSNDKMFFYSESPGYYDSSVFTAANSGLKATVSLVGYCIYATGTNPLFPAYSLLRLSKGLAWDSSTPANGPGGMLFLTSPSPGSTPIPASSLPGATGQPNWNGAIGFPPYYNGTDLTDYDVLANQVLRMEFCFQVKDLTNPNSPGSAYSNYPIAYFGSTATNKATAGGTIITSGAIGDRWYDTANNRAYVCTGLTGSTPNWTPNGMSDVTAIIVAIAILDPASRKLAPNALGAISAALLDPTQDATATGLLAQPPHLMVETWQNAINATSPTFASTTGVPTTAASQVRVYQRYFYLNNK